MYPHRSVVYHLCVSYEGKNNSAECGGNNALGMMRKKGFHIGDAAANFLCVKRHTEFATALKLLLQTNF